MLSLQSVFAIPSHHHEWPFVFGILPKKKPQSKFCCCWNIVDLECFFSFRCTAKWFSYTCIYSFPNSFAFNWLQNTEQFPMLHSRSLLVVCFIGKYSTVYMSIPNFLITSPTHPCPLVTISLFFKSLTLFLFCKKVLLYHTFLRFHM